MLAFSAGLTAASPDMEDTLDKYLDDTKTYDISILATLGLTDEDITKLEELEQIEKAYGVQNKDYIIEMAGKEYVAQIIEYNENVNTPYLVQGRMPENNTECLIEKEFLEYNKYNIGDKIIIKTDEEEVVQKELTIVGICESSLYISNERGNTSLGTGTVNCYIFAKDIFNFDYYTTIYAKVKGAQELETYKDEYENLVEQVENKIKEIQTERENARYNELVGEAQSKLDEEKAKFEQEKADAQAKIDDAQNKINNGENEINVNQNKLNTAKRDLETQMAQAEQLIAEAQAQITENEAALEALKQSEQAATEEGQLQIAQMEQAISVAKTQLEAQKQEVENSRISANNEINNSQAQINSAKAELETARQELETAKQEYDTKIADAEKKIADAQKEIDDIEKNKWYIQTRDDNTGYSSILQAIESIQNLATIFPIVFYAIAVLTSLTSMTRMIEEERTEIGTLKALGYSNLSILSKYISYASIACILGGLIGMSICFYLFPTIIWNTYGLLYKVPNLMTPFRFEYGIIGLGIAYICIVGATLIVSIRELKEMPANLMRPKAPKSGKRVLLEKIKIIWNHLSFSRKVTVRNLFRYKKKSLMTIIGIAGCTALILVGFGIRDSITQIVDKQYGTIHTYDSMIYVDNDVDTTIESLKQNSEITNIVKVTAETGEIEKNGTKKSINIIVPEDTKEFETVCKLYDVEEQEVHLEDNGIIITEKIAELLDIHEGEEITLILSGTQEYKFKVQKIVKNYINHYAYISKATYNQVIGDTDVNVLWTNLADLSKEEQDALVEKILQNDNITSITMLETMIETVNDMLGALDYVIVILILSSAILAFTVLYNLANINISERKREIATLKVLGFYDREVDAYINRESIIFTIIGIIVGLIIGYFLTHFIIATCETESFRFIRQVHPLSYLYSILITATFSIIVNFIIHFSLKKINMIESLKSIE